MPYILQVGKPYVPGKASLAPFANYNLRGGTHELLLVMGGLTAKEIEAVRKGESEFALVIHRRVIFFLYRFGDGFKWSDAPYSIWMLPESDRIAPEATGPETRALLQTILVDADQNLTQAIRATTLSPEFTTALHAAIADQLAEKISIQQLEVAVREAYATWPRTSDMLASALVRCKGGA